MLTKDEYFAAISRWPWDWPGSEGVPIGWVREAWDSEDVQGSIVAGGLARDVSKTGSLGASGEFLLYLAETLTEAQVVALYLSIRNGCETREEEFRPEFLVAFARHAHAIPPALTRGELAERLGLTAEEAEAYPNRWRRTPYGEPTAGDGDEIPFWKACLLSSGFCPLVAVSDPKALKGDAKKSERLERLSRDL